MEKNSSILIFSVCKKNVTIFKLYPDASQWGGSRQDRVYEETECKELCMNDTRCKAVDFSKWEKSCWTHIYTKPNAQSRSTCCRHYKKIETCECKLAVQYRHVIPAPVDRTSDSVWFNKYPEITCQNNKPIISMTRVAFELKQLSVMRSSMNPCPGNWMGMQLCNMPVLPMHLVQELNVGIVPLQHFKFIS